MDVDNSVPGQITLTVSAAGFNAPSDATLRSISFGNANANVDPTARNITVTVSDANNSSVAAHSTVTIAGAVNDPGVALDDTAATAGNTTLSVAAAQGVLANDNDPDGLTVITGIVATSQGGTTHFAADGSLCVHAGRLLHRHRHGLLHRAGPVRQPGQRDLARRCRRRARHGGRRQLHGAAWQFGDRRRPRR